MKIYAIEMSSECNIRCTYCPQPDMARTKEHMPLDIFAKVLDYPMALDGVAGHLFGEALLHPDLLEMALMCKVRNLDFGFSTNALLLRLEYLEKLIDAGLTWIVISYHIPKAAKIESAVREAFPDLPVYNNILEVKHDWAGQVDHTTKNNVRQNVQNTSAANGDCIFHEYDFATISSQGEIYACCMDAEGVSSFGSLFQYTPSEFAELRNEMWFSLCDECSERVSPTALKEIYGSFEQISGQVNVFKDKVSKGLDRRIICTDADQPLTEAV